MKNIVLFKTQNKYFYLFLLNKKQLFLIDEITFRIMHLVTEGMHINTLKGKHIGYRKIIVKYKQPFSYYLHKAQFYLSKENKAEPVISENYCSNNLIRNLLKNPQIVFEVTEQCNLKCKYCVYGSFYEGSEKRNQNNLSIESAKNLIDYIANLNGTLTSQNITISFYGGEPLLKYNFVKEIVDYCNTTSFKNKSFIFSMTTNGTLVYKYIDFLINNRFKILISLDGNNSNNQYRVYKNGKDSFTSILKNLDKIRFNFPVFFKENIKFNSVLHDKNSIKEIDDFFISNFNQHSMISEISTDGVKLSMKEPFKAIRKSKLEDLNNSKEYYKYLLCNDVKRTPDFDSSMGFIFTMTNLKLKNLNELNKLNNTPEKIIPTGTCLPFQRKIFVTSNGFILPCENIDHKHAIGSVDNKGVQINLHAIAAHHNQLIENMALRCTSCPMLYSCSQCIYSMEFQDGFPICRERMDNKNIEEFLKEQVSFFEKSPNILKTILYETEVN